MSVSNIVFHELIGLHVAVVESSDETLKGLSGEVIDETKQTLKVKCEKGVKIVPKANVTLKVDLPDGESVNIYGKRIMHRPEDRIRRMSFRR
ncbi:MAG: ribonuclease P protein subunit [Thaumarchaeota archaeon]|nr:ribonuclease P protein subunit [Nitrososphaerota archaeon]MCL5318004.1 ribonuclease P protein subunit [Nitrososphaerota archaeon]